MENIILWGVIGVWIQCITIVAYVVYATHLIESDNSKLLDTLKQQNASLKGHMDGCISSMQRLSDENHSLKIELAKLKETKG